MDKKYFVFRGIDRADSQWMREQLLSEHRTYVRSANAVRMLHGGPLCDDTGQPVGSCLILEADSSAKVRTWLSAEPFFKSGLFANSSVEQWGWTYGR